MKKKITFITNIPSPYRVFFFNELAKQNDIDLIVLYCASNELNRFWEGLKLNHKHIYLAKGLLPNKKRSFKYFNKDIWSKLKAINPDIIITGGYYPTILLAIFFAWLKKKKHFINTDGWWLTEQGLAFYHKWLRKFIYRRATGFTPISIKGKQTILQYGVPESKILPIPYIIDTLQYQKKLHSKKIYDLVYSAHFIQRKMPLFVVNVLREVQKYKKDVNILILGSGPLKEELLQNLEELNIDYHYPGFIQPDKLPAYYAASKILLFPTQMDGWGVIANEAAALGLPIITCENAGAAGDLILDNYNGFITPPNATIWAEKICALLSSKDLYNHMSENALKHIKEYSSDKVVKNFIDFIK